MVCICLVPQLLHTLCLFLRVQINCCNEGFFFFKPLYISVIISLNTYWRYRDVTFEQVDSSGATFRSSLVLSGLFATVPKFRDFGISREMLHKMASVNTVTFYHIQGYSKNYEGYGRITIGWICTGRSSFPAWLFSAFGRRYWSHQEWRMVLNGISKMDRKFPDSKKGWCILCMEMDRD